VRCDRRHVQGGNGGGQRRHGVHCRAKRVHPPQRLQPGEPSAAQPGRVDAGGRVDACARGSGVGGQHGGETVKR
jgi:hypothetical protein